MRRFAKFFLTSLALAGLLFLFSSVTPAFAQTAPGDTFGLNTLNENLKLGGGDIREIAARYINIALGLLGLVTVGLILYGGFLYMTSGGSEDKIAEGKKYITNAVIGLVIILSAWAIVQFVFSQLSGAIVGNNGLPGGGGSGDGTPLDVCDPASANYNPKQCESLCALHPEYSVCQKTAFYVQAITPGTVEKSETTGMDNIRIRVLFSRPLAKDTNLAKAFTVARAMDGVQTQMPLSISTVENNQILEAFIPNDTGAVRLANYQVTVSNDLKDVSGQTLQPKIEVAGNTYYSAAGFTIDEYLNDAVKPQISNLRLNNTSGANLVFTANQNITAAGNITDRYGNVNYGGVGLLKLVFTDESGAVVLTDFTAPRVTVGSTQPFDFDYTTKLDSRFAVGKKYTLTITATDITSNSTAASISFIVKAAHCDNNVKDGDETGVDTGGSCGGGSGDSCTVTADCATGFQCIDKICTAAPVITSVDPGNGAPGSWVTINGKNFGVKTGRVYFGIDKNKNNSYEDSEWVEATVVNCGGGSSWDAASVIVAVPGPNPDFSTGAFAPIKIVDGNGKLFDTTINDFGPKLNADGLFAINTVQRPGLCQIGVTRDTEITLGGKKVTLVSGSNSAVPLVDVTTRGSGLGTKNTATDRLVFGGVKNPSTGALTGGYVADPISPSSWTDQMINTRVPANLQPAVYSVYASVAGQTSNGIKFTVLSPDQAVGSPVISTIDPAKTTGGSYVTLSGSGFGDFTGQVFLAKDATALSTCWSTSADASCKALNVTDFPTQCGTTWSDKQVVAQVPLVDPGKYAIGLQNTLKFRTNGQDSLEIVAGAARPSICRLVPERGPAPLAAGSTGLTLYGVNFPKPATVLYWKKGASATDANTWFSSAKDTAPGNAALIKENTATKLVTLLPVSSGTSMVTGPIKIAGQTADTGSNSVNYTVESCVDSKTALPGYHCCVKGPETGQWKQNALACQGEAREAGYLWRFTTGILAYAPSVVEQCNAVDFPSPTPRVKGVPFGNAAACVNSTLAVRFSMDMDQTTFNSSTVKVYTCDQGSTGQIDCAKNKKLVQPLTLSYQNAGKTLIIRQTPPATELLANTWYQVEISDAVKSKQIGNVLGKEATVSASLVATKPCGAGTAYCYAFKTSGKQCNLIDAGINPAEYKATQLGIIQDPRFAFDSSNLFLPTQNPPEKVPSFPNYFYVWGKGDQECSVINVDQYAWVWSPGLAGPDSEFASAFKSPKAGTTSTLPYFNSRGIVAARAQTAPNFVPIKAQVSLPNPNAGSSAAYDSIGGVDVLKTAGFSVDSVTGYNPGTVVSLPAAADVINVGSSFTLQFKYTKSPSVSSVNLLEKRTAATPKVGYRINLNSNIVCFTTYTAATSPFDKKHCFTPTSDSKGVYNVALSWDSSSKKLIWTDLHASTNRAEMALNSIPAVSDTATLNSAVIPSSDPGLSYFALNYRAEAVNFGNESEITFAPISKLTIDLADPALVYFEPNCIESCVNASIRADFNRQMDASSYAAGFKVFKCLDGVECKNAVPTSLYTIDTEGSTATTLRASIVSAGSNLDPNTYYKVSLNGSGNENTVRALVSETPRVLGKALPTTEWIFKTKNDGKPCAISALTVVPVSFKAEKVGQKDIFTVVPYSAPNACSKVGQPLNKWSYQYNWSTADQKVAKVSDIKPAYYSNIPGYCTNYCTKKGSGVAQDVVANVALCGNGKVELGEDCDVAAAGENPGVSCSLNCLRPGNQRGLSTKDTGSSICGNGIVETNVGEQCDPGGVAGAVKTDDPICTSQCLLRGSSTKFSGAVGTAVCGDGVVTAGQEMCDVADGNTKVGCTNACLHSGTKLAAYWCEANTTSFGDYPQCKASVSVCGNGKLENSEDCEVGVNGVTAKMCNAQCLFIDACDLPVTQRPCEAGAPGCSDKCTLLGSRTTYNPASICGDHIKGIGENKSCELPDKSGVSMESSGGPNQLVEAVGEGNIVSGQDYQETQVQVQTKVENKVVSSTARYQVQCGYTEFVAPTTDGRYNDCNLNTNNNLGVDAQSCCVPRPKRMSEYPVDGTGFSGSEAACRNTYIEVDFDKEIRTETLANNLLLIKGFAASNFDCATSSVGGQDVTGFVNQTLAFDSGANPGFWARVWSWVKHLFGTDTTATSVKDTAEFKQNKTWCTVANPLTIDSHTVEINSKKTTVTSVAITQALDANAYYGVLLRGDQGGIVDVRGVPLRGKDGSPVAGRNDSWFFKTGTDICKITGVSVSPNSQLFSKPNTSFDFKAVASGTGSQKIVPTLGYRWVWNWLPQTNPVFDFAQQNPADVLKVTSKTAPGQVTGVAQAQITEDVSQENNQKGKNFSGTFELTAFFCERPWPTASQYPYQDTTYNFSTGYCADAGVANNSTDDLPVLNDPIVLTGAVAGATDSLKKLVFFNDKNDDVIGVQIFASDLPLTEWYTQKFGSLGSMKPGTVGGYAALSDGNNYYVQALNLNSGATSAASDDKVYSNVYLFSINPNATDSTKSAFSKFLGAMEFNINITDHGKCLAPGGNIRSNPSLFSEVSCATDFDCRDAAGVEKAGTIGVCSNAKTKFQRDWKRLADIRTAQDRLDNYFDAHKNEIDFKGALSSGTFAPGYTVTKWGQSWGALQTLVGGLPTDPLNRWTECGASDRETCWDTAKTTYFCPKFASVYEYEYKKDTKTYVFHAPLEFFTTQDAVTQEQISLEKFSPSRWSGCDSGAYNPFKEQCGDGILNASEQCEPPGKVSLEDSYPSGVAQAGSCRSWPIRQACETDSNCGFTTDPAVGPVYRTFGAAPSICVGPTGYPVAVEQGTYDFKNYNTANPTKKNYLTFACSSDAYCNNPDSYKIYNSPNFFVDAPHQVTYSERDFFGSFFPETAGRFKCEKNTFSNMTLGQCVGYKAPGTFNTSCSAGSKVAVTCSNECKKQYGSCQSTGSCGNGVVEGSEACDDGALNNTYGHCNNSCSGLSAAACGNNKKDFADTNGNGFRDTGEKEYEYCDAGVDGFTANYNLNKAKSCSWDCQTTGGYCGDNLVQANEGEMCDDGNTTDDATCMSNCQLPALSCLQATAALKINNESYAINTTATTTEFLVYNQGTPIDASALLQKFPAGESCSAATPRALCASANLTCKNFTTVDGTGKTTSVACDSKFGGIGGTKLVADTTLQSLIYPNANTVRLAYVWCNGAYANGAGSTNDIASGGSCGNGKLEKERGEQCDNGGNNDVQCKPAVGQKQCTYCGNGCKILTVDNPIFCGNGTIDPGEQCEFTASGVVKRLYSPDFIDTSYKSCLSGCTSGNSVCVNACDILKNSMINDNKSEPAVCSELGEYQCSNSCKSLDNLCVSCNVKPNGTFALANILNPIMLDWSAWQDTNKYTLNLMHLVKNSSGVTTKQSIGSTQINGLTTGSGIIGFQPLTGGTNIQIEASPQCTNNYSLAFNVGKNLSADQYSSFSYPVNGETAQVMQDVIMSPALYPGTFRVVVVATGGSAANGDLLDGSVYNELYSSIDPNAPNVGDTGPQTFSNRVDNLRCSQMKRAGDYWVPGPGKTSIGSSETCSDVGGVAVSRSQTSISGKTYLQSFTIDTNDYKQSGDTFAFYLRSIDKNIYEHRGDAIEVWVYKSNPKQNSLYSVYQPDYRFKINLAQDGASSAVSWHVFNLVRVDAQNYDVRLVPKIDAAGNQIGEYSDGMFQSSLCATKAHMPGATKCAP